MASSSSISDNTEEESIISYYFSRGHTYEVITEFLAKFHSITMSIKYSRTSRKRPWPKMLVSECQCQYQITVSENFILFWKRSLSATKFRCVLKNILVFCKILLCSQKYCCVLENIVVFSKRLLCSRKHCCVSEEKLSCVLPLWATVLITALTPKYNNAWRSRLIHALRIYVLS